GFRQIDKGVADELDGYVALPINRLLEWKDHQHEVGDLTNGLQSAGAPGPDLRGDIVHDRHAQPFYPLSEPEIEVREIDDAQGAGPGLTRRRHHSSHDRERLWDLADGLGQSGHGETSIVSDQLSPGRGKLWPAESADNDRGVEKPQFACEGPGVQIAGRLATRQHEAGQGVGRWNRAASRGALTRIESTCRARIC